MKGCIMNAYNKNMSKYVLIKAKTSYWKDKNENDIIKYKIKYTETTFERRTLESFIWVKK